METRRADENKEKCLRWLESVNSPSPAELPRHGVAEAKSDPLLKLEDVEQEDKFATITHSPIVDRKILTYPPDRYSRELHRSCTTPLEADRAMLYRQGASGCLNGKQQCNQLLSRSQTSIASGGSSHSMSMRGKHRHRTHSDHGGSPGRCRLLLDKSRVQNFHSETVGAADGMKLPLIPSSRNLTLTRKHSGDSHDRKVVTMTTTRPTLTRSLLEYHDKEPLKYQWNSDLFVQGCGMRAEHFHHLEEHGMKVLTKKNLGSPLVVRARPTVSTIGDRRVDGIGRLDSPSSMECLVSGHLHGQTQTHSVMLGRRKLSSGTRHRPSRSVGEPVVINKRTDSSVSSVTRTPRVAISGARDHVSL